MQLKVASYNIHKSVGSDRRRDPERIIAVLREIDADIIALQEADRRIGQRASTIPRALIDDTRWRALPVAKRRRSLGWHGNALLVRRNINLIACEPLALPTLEPRGAVAASLSITGTVIHVIGTHLDLSGIRRRAQINALLGHLRQRHHGPAILLGDFNQWGHRTGAMRAFGSEWQIAKTGPSFPSRHPLAALDRIVTDSNWRALGSGVHHSALATQASDHLPVFAQLELPKI